MNKFLDRILRNLGTIVLVGPFVLSVVFLLFNLYFIAEISLLPSFSINPFAVVIVAVVHFSLLAYVSSGNQIKLIVILKPTFIKKIALYVFSAMIFLLFSILFVMSVKMNLNYWLRSDSKEDIELVVINKHISYGRVTDHYVNFSSPKGNFQTKVKRKNYEKFIIGDVLETEVNIGSFEGCFLTKKLNFDD